MEHVGMVKHPRCPGCEAEWDFAEAQKAYLGHKIQHMASRGEVLVLPGIFCSSSSSSSSSEQLLAVASESKAS
ncbi:hypothetical protein EYF80_012390 [Liparis tanakae]|uniref:Uncharacterized protein n=1 Tax=Liparis tanakae TaxID=230148 RepID=A0A4Z2IHM6_9TELE|nr:hypothetical protein EYF80_012390 [Liparis tanakae]